VPGGRAGRPWAAALEAIAGYDRSDRVAAIGVPVMLIAAELDPVSTPAAMSALASRLPQASLTVLPGAAHMSPFIDPAALARLIQGN
jgi:pimeloyl-ACP methyl ester carboxylesterase